jgi:hypothetical protein
MLSRVVSGTALHDRDGTWTAYNSHTCNSVRRHGCFWHVVATSTGSDSLADFSCSHRIAQALNDQHRLVHL